MEEVSILFTGTVVVWVGAVVFDVAGVVGFVVLEVVGVVVFVGGVITPEGLFWG